MENITLLEANKPEKVQEAVNELLAFKNEGFSGAAKDQIGLGNVDNTADVNKPLSAPQKAYIDQRDALHVKKASETPQTIDSDIVLAEDKSLFIERGNGQVPRVLSIENDSGYENVEVGSDNVPLRLHHAVKDINETVVGRNPKVSVKDAQGGLSEERVSFLSDVSANVQSAKNDLYEAIQGESDRAKDAENEKVDKSVFENAEVENGVVTSVTGDYYTDVTADVMNLHITTRSVIDGSIIADVILPLKLASELSRGLMSMEQVITLSDLVNRVASIEGKTSRYIYTVSDSPTAADIDEFAQIQGQAAPYVGVAVVIAGTYHIWHYYENDGIGWRDDGSDTVNQASNASYGIVIGSAAVGKIFIEADGSMSVVGFDALSSRVTSLENSRLSDISVSGGANNGTVKVVKNVNGTNSTTDNIPVTGLKSAAFTEASSYATAAQGAKADTAYQKPTSGIPLSDLGSGVIPSVGNGKITIKQGGVEKGSFTVNQTGETIIDLEQGGGGGEQGMLYIIEAAELPNVTFRLSNSAGDFLSSLQTGATGGKVKFIVTNQDTYTVKAVNAAQTELWSRTVTIDRVGVYLVKTNKPLNNYTWDEINTASVGGYAKYMWSAGDTKDLSSVMGQTSSTYTRSAIIGFDHDDKAGGGKAGITFKLPFGSSMYTHNASSSANINGISWLGSNIRQNCLKAGESTYVYDISVTSSTSGTYYVFNEASQSFSEVSLPSAYVSGTKYYTLVTASSNGAFIAGMPSDVLSVIKQAKKKTWGGYGNSAGMSDNTVFQTKDWLFIPSGCEVFGTTDRCSTANDRYTLEGEQYEFFKQGKENRVRSDYTSWLRSPAPISSPSFAYWNSFGYVGSYSATTGYRVVLCFCI